MEAVNLEALTDEIYALHEQSETRVHGTLHYGSAWPDNVYSCTMLTAFALLALQFFSMISLNAKFCKLTFANIFFNLRFSSSSVLDLARSDTLTPPNYVTIYNRCFDRGHLADINEVLTSTLIHLFLEEQIFKIL